MLSLPTPPKCFAASVLATLHAAFARKVRARPSGCSTFEAIWVHLRYGPVARSPSFLDGFVNRLQDFQFPSFLLFKLRGFELLPRWDFHPLFMPAFAGRTLTILNPPTFSPSCAGTKPLAPVFGWLLLCLIDHEDLDRPLMALAAFESELRFLTQEPFSSTPLATNWGEFGHPLRRLSSIPTVPHEVRPCR